MCLLPDTTIYFRERERERPICPSTQGEHDTDWLGCGMKLLPRMREWAPEALAIFNGRIDKNVMSGGEGVWGCIPVSWQHEYFSINTHLEALFIHTHTQRMQRTFHMAYEQYAKKCFFCMRNVCDGERRERKKGNYIAPRVCCLYPIKVVINNAARLKSFHAALQHSLNTRGWGPLHVLASKKWLKI